MILAPPALYSPGSRESATALIPAFIASMIFAIDHLPFGFDRRKFLRWRICVWRAKSAAGQPRRDFPEVCFNSKCVT
jgi:hypothetical protein